VHNCVFCAKICSAVLAVGNIKIHKNKKQPRQHVVHKVMNAYKQEWIWTQFCMHRYPRHNHLHKFWMGCWYGNASNFSRLYKVLLLRTTRQVYIIILTTLSHYFAIVVITKLRREVNMQAQF